MAADRMAEYIANVLILAQVSKDKTRINANIYSIKHKICLRQNSKYKFKTIAFLTIYFGSVPVLGYFSPTVVMSQ